MAISWLEHVWKNYDCKNTVNIGISLHSLADKCPGTGDKYCGIRTSSFASDVTPNYARPVKPEVGFTGGQTT